MRRRWIGLVPGWGRWGGCEGAVCLEVREEDVRMIEWKYELSGGGETITYSLRIFVFLLSFGLVSAGLFSVS